MADDELRQYRQLCAASRRASERSRAHAVDLEQHPARLDHGNPVVVAPLPLPIRTSWGFGGDRFVGKNAYQVLPSRFM